MIEWYWFVIVVSATHLALFGMGYLCGKFKGVKQTMDYLRSIGRI